jgi:hypothetical protein
VLGGGKYEMIRNFAKLVGTAVPAWILQRMAAESIFRKEFEPLLSGSLPMPSREALWDHGLSVINGRATCYVEFGVYQGYSMRYFSGHIKDPKAVFFGLDTFSGLPERWGTVESGKFDVSGNFPQIDDKRVTFMKGMFWESWPQLYKRLPSYSTHELLVNFDADLYSSTLFALSKLDNLRRPYLALFDEFYGDEPRALSDYMSSHGAKVEFLAYTGSSKAVAQVLARIIPQSDNSPTTNGRL